MLRLENISKHFQGVRALQNVTLDFEQGTIHAICGENGAGKSTLMNIIMGIHQPDEGTISWKGEQLQIKNVSAAYDLGISIVYQERSLVDSLSIAENIFPVNLPATSAGIIDFTKLHTQAQLLLNELGLATLSPKITVGKLSTAQKQMVEIAKAIAQKPAVLILDEPTASITSSETEILFNILRTLKRKGVAIIYISHRMAEIQEIADIVSVLKDGKFVATVEATTPSPEIIHLMVGRDLEVVTGTSHVQNEILFEARNICGKGFSNINFQLKKGEILGFAGLEGSGRSAMAKALFADEILLSGQVIKGGKTVSITHPSTAINHGIVYLPEDRKAEGLFLQKSVSENIFSVRLRKGIYSESVANAESSRLCATFGVRTPTVKQHVRKLSGGNQQKTMLAKWLAINPEVLIVNEPTHGVDVGSKAEIYQLLKKMTAEGKSILLISSELPELLLLCDRIAVMRDGKINAVLSRNEATEANITAFASGISDQ